MIATDLVQMLLSDTEELLLDSTIGSRVSDLLVPSTDEVFRSGFNLVRLTLAPNQDLLFYPKYEPLKIGALRSDRPRVACQIMPGRLMDPKLPDGRTMGWRSLPDYAQLAALSVSLWSCATADEEILPRQNNDGFGPIRVRFVQQVTLYFEKNQSLSFRWSDDDGMLHLD